MRKMLFILMAMLSSCTQTPDKPGTYKGYQLPDYTVLRRDEAFEIRNYAPQLVAEVMVQGGRNEAVSKGFRLLAEYIFGGNIPQKQVAMTTPVTQEKQGKSWKVQFGMPKEYTLETLPKAKNPQVKFLTLPAHQKVTIRFSGRATDESLAAHKAKLVSWIKQQQLTPSGALAYAYYDDPFTLPSNRRNEVLMELK